MSFYRLRLRSIRTFGVYTQELLFSIALGTKVHLILPWTSSGHGKERRTQNTKLVTEVGFLLASAEATQCQLSSIAERPRANNDEHRKINDQHEPYIAEDAFDKEFSSVLKYDD